MTYSEFINTNGHICSESEFEIAKAQAKNKLAVIVSRFGDANGQRLQDDYLNQLVIEEIRAERLSNLVVDLFNSKKISHIA